METEQTGSQVEIKHLGDYDILVSRSVSDSELVRNLLLTVTNNINADGNPLHDWTTCSNSRFHANSLDDPKYLAKTRWFSVMSDRSEMLRGKFPYGSKRARAHASLMNEFVISPKVNQIIEADDLQKFVKKLGFLEIRLSKPLLGLINRNTQEKTTIYKFIKGRPFAKLDDDDFVREGGVAICNQVGLTLRLSGIRAFDLNLGQFIIDETPKGKVIHLIDIEGYIPEKP